MYNGKCQACEAYGLVNDINLCDGCSDSLDSDSKLWEEHDAERKAKRWANDKNSIAILEKRKLPFVTLNKACSHYRLGDYDFWATTGKFINRNTKVAGRGVFNLIRAYGKTSKQN